MYFFPISGDVHRGSGDAPWVECVAPIPECVYRGSEGVGVFALVRKYESTQTSAESRTEEEKGGDVLSMHTKRLGNTHRRW